MGRYRYPRYLAVAALSICGGALAGISLGWLYGYTSAYLYQLQVARDLRARRH